MKNSKRGTPLGAFSETPLLTPERVKAEGAEAFAILPDWVHSCYRLNDLMVEIPQDRYLVVLDKNRAERHRTRGTNSTARYDKPFTVIGLQLAILAEASRYGGSVVLNDSRTGGKDGKGLVYWKLTGSKSTEHVDVPRLWADAGPGEIVTKSSTIAGHDHSPGSFAKEGGPSKKEARSVLLAQAQRRASRHLKHKPAALAAFLKNLERLLAAYDAEVEAALAT